MSEVVYEPAKSHKHHMQSRAHQEDVGKIVKCSCGKFFYMYDTAYGGEYHRDGGYAYWTQVRWYHWRQQKLIKEWEKK